MTFLDILNTLQKHYVRIFSWYEGQIKCYGQYGDLVDLKSILFTNDYFDILDHLREQNYPDFTLTLS